MLFRVYLKTLVTIIAAVLITAVEWTNNWREGKEKERDKTKVNCVREREREKNEREVADRYTINNRDEQQRRWGFVRFQPLIYCIEKMNSSSTHSIHWRGKKKNEQNERTNDTKLYIVSSPSSSSNEVEYERTCLCVRMWW
jgi:aspartyl/asparaginyl beta-hydroxylase (cupin superfamily)